MYLEGNRMDLSGYIVVTYLFLSKMYITIHTAILQVYTHMLRICTTGSHQAWSFQGVVSGYQTYLKMSSMGWEWLRSRAMTFEDKE